MANQGIRWNHSNDVILNENSFLNFISLIQANGDLSKIKFFSMRDAYENDKITEFTPTEKENHKRDIAVVRYDLPLTSTPTTTGYSSTNGQQILGRHQFLRTGSDVSITTGNDLGTISATVDDVTSEIYVQGFSKIINSSLPGVKFDGHFLPAVASKYFLGSESMPWNSIYADNLITNAITATGAVNIAGNTTIGSANNQKSVTINGRNIAIASLPKETSDNTKFLLGDGSWGNELNNNFLPKTNQTFDLGSSTKKWKNLYLSGEIQANNLTLTGTLKDKDGDEIRNSFYGASLSYSDSTLSLKNKKGTTLSSCTIVVSDQKTSSSNTTNKIFLVGATTQTTAGVTTYSNSNVYTLSGEIWATKVHNAIFNDYAECRKTINLKPGRVVVDNDDGSLSCSSQRLQPGAQVISDTYGNLMGETDDCKTPLAVAGRVLTYTYQPRENYHAGMAVCSAPNGTIDIMTREEIVQYPDCIMGIVSEIPNYDTWGTDRVKVDGRIWIKVR